jgi:hypothetical protein
MKQFKLIPTQVKAFIANIAGVDFRLRLKSQVIAKQSAMTD